jgi:two-component system sensor histidine kinase BaeS
VTHGFGRLGLQLTLAFIAVAVVAVATATIIISFAVTGYEAQVRNQQQDQETAALAVAAAATYSRSNWSTTWTPVRAAADRLDAEAQVRDRAGHVVRSSPRFAGPPASGAYSSPITIRGRRVGTLVMRFGDRGLTALLTRFNAQRWRARIIGGCAAAILAGAAALFLARRITAPLQQLLGAARDRASGRVDARAGIVSGFRDIRQLAAAFDHMADVLDRQEQVRRNLVADVTHELRTPVAVMQGETEAMLDGVKPISRNDVQSLHEEILRLGRMIGDLQRLAAAEAAAMQLRLTACDLADPVAAAARSLQGTFGNEGVNLQLRLTNTPACCDPVRMQDVVRNLLTNAAKYTPAGGTVVVETRPVGNSANLRVVDTGVGIPAQDLPRITERFYRGSRTQGIRGSGVGLAVVDALIRAQHGALDITSELGQGTQVTITLPAPRLN